MSSDLITLYITASSILENLGEEAIYVNTLETT